MMIKKLISFRPQIQSSFRYTNSAYIFIFCLKNIHTLETNSLHKQSIKINDIFIDYLYIEKYTISLFFHRQNYI